MRKIASLLAVLMVLCTLAFAQTRTITGVVKDEKGDPIPFATITESGTKNAVQADINGHFSIRTAAGKLVITATGHQSQTVTITGETVNAVLPTQANQLAEVVVTTALGIQKQAKELGYSSATLQSKDIVAAKPINVANGLTGKVAGLEVSTTNNGLFAPTRITLRGNRSLIGNNQPLVVVDGAIFYNDISTLNPNDIAEVNILKGASASAIYGSDASNGVIIITTKKGTRGKPTLTLSTTVTAERLAFLPALQNEFGNNGGEKFVDDFNDLNDFIPYENQSYGPKFNGKMVPLGRPLADGSVLMVPYSARPNEKRDFFATGVTTQNDMSYQAGDENSRFFMSLQDLSTSSIMPGDRGRRDAFRVGGSKTHGVFSAVYSLSYTYKYTNTTNTGNIYELVMNTPAEVPLTSLKDWRNNKFATLDGYYNDYYDNPYWDIDNQRNKTTNNGVTGNLQLNLKPLSWLNFSYRLGVNNLSQRYEYTASPHNYSEFARTNATVLYSNPDGTGLDTVQEAPKYAAAAAGAAGLAASYTSSSYNNFLLTSDFVASADKNINKDFNLKVSVGTSYLDNLINGLYVAAPALVIPVYNITNVSGIPNIGNTGNNYNAEARKIGFFGEGTIGFKQYAFLHGSYRTDIDSRLSKDNRFIPYYDVDASFVLSDAVKSITNNNVLSFAKVRGAHSVTGNASALSYGSANIASGAYVIDPSYYVATGFPYGSLGGYSISTSVANPNLKPETLTEDELGLELGFFHNRYYLKASVYQQNLKDGIVPASTSSASGFYSALLNAANVKNQGIELDLTANIIRTKNLSWNFGVNYSYNENKVISINGNLPSLGLSGANGNSFAVVGDPFPVIETHDWVRDAAGHVVVDPTTGDPKENPNLVIFGQANPKNIVGLTSTLTWKRLTFTVTADYRSGNKIFNSIGQYMDFTGISKTTASTGRQPFVFPNSVTVDANGKSTPNTSIMVDDANFNFWPGLYRSVGGNYVTSANVFKLREVAIAYDIPKKVYGITKIVTGASFTVSGRDLFMIRPKSNLWTDPEFNDDTGNDLGRTTENELPPTRKVSATLSITF